MAQLINVTMVAPFPDLAITGGAATIAVANIQFISDNTAGVKNKYGDTSAGVTRIVYKRTVRNHFLTSVMYVAETRPALVTAAG